MRWPFRWRAAIAPDIPGPAPGVPQCNICGGTRFSVDKRGFPVCAACRSRPRHRAMMLAIERVAGLRAGMRVLHLAPEAGIAARIVKVVGAGYDPRDFDNNAAAQRIGRPVQRIDLCENGSELDADAYDLVLHNHVIEHLPCNYTMALLGLHRAVKPGGYHLFTAPMTGGYFREDLDPGLAPEERTGRFLQADHMRRFGTEDFEQSLGAVFGLKRSYSMLDFMSEADLTAANIPAKLQRGPSGASVFIVRKPA